MYESFINFILINIVRFPIELVMSSIGRLFGIRNAFNRTRSVSPNPTNETASCEHRPVIQKQHINRMERTVSEPHRISLRISPPKLISDDAFDNAQVLFFAYILFFTKFSVLNFCEGIFHHIYPI